MRLLLIFAIFLCKGNVNNVFVNEHPKYNTNSTNQTHIQNKWGEPFQSVLEKIKDALKAE